MSTSTTTTSKPLKPKRGTTAQNNNYTGEAYEVTLDTDKKTLVVHDGLTAGGFPLARADEVAAKDAAQDEAIAGKLDTSGGTMTRSLYMGKGTSINFDTEAHIYATDTSEFTIHGGGQWDKCAKTTWWGKDASNGDAGDWTTYGYDPTDGTMTELRIDASERTVKINSIPLLTSAGGTLTGAVNAPDFGGVDPTGWLRLWPTTPWLNATRIQLAGADNVDHLGQVWLVGNDGAKETVFKILPGEGAFISGKPVAVGYGLSSSNVVVKRQAGNKVTVPSGGTWIYFTIGAANSYDHCGFNVGTAAGGQTLTFSTWEQLAALFLRIA